LEVATYNYSKKGVYNLNSILEAIISRRSIRNFTKKKVEDDKINSILKAAIWAPSGLNNQPWKFIVIENENTIQSLSKLTHYEKVVKNSPLLIAVFLDSDESYNFVKDVQAIGASIQNMLLASFEMELGSVWLGEILNNKYEVHKLLDTPENFELMAIVALGYPVNKEQKSTRKNLHEVVYYEHYQSKVV